MLQVFKFQFGEVEELQSLLKRREAFLVLYTKAVNLQSKKEATQMQLRAKGKADKADKMEDDIVKCKKEVEQSKYVVDFMTKAMFFLELDTFHRERLINFKNMLGIFTSIYISMKLKFFYLFK